MENSLEVFGWQTYVLAETLNFNVFQPGRNPLTRIFIFVN